ncbi:MAG: cell division protein FtsA [Bacteroidales bacterium]|nr:cell division protein FtsA [Bacteroidales bacterium]
MTVKNIAEEYVTAIDLGSSKIVGLLAKRTPGKGIEIVAEHIVNSGNCIKRGTIYNFTEATALIKQVVASLELKSGENLKKINVNISGQSLRSRFNDEIEIHLENNESVSEEDVKSIEEEIHEQVVADYEIICNTKPSFFVDGNPVANPVGVVGLLLQAEYQQIIARPTLKKNISKCFAEEEIVVNYLIGPMASAESLITENEKKIGVAVVDFGAGTTSLCIYKNGELIHLAVIPFGGNNITNDLCALNIRDEEAENLKKRLGCIAVNSEKNNNTIKSYNGSEISEAEISLIIEARQTEIWANVWRQIQDLGMDKELAAGIVITGGASSMKGLSELIIKKTSINVRQAFPVCYNSKSQKEDNLPPSYSEVVGLITGGDFSFVKEDNKPEKEIQHHVSEPISEHETWKQEEKEHVEEKKEKREEKKEERKPKIARGSFFGSSLKKGIQGLFPNEPEEDDFK